MHKTVFIFDSEYQITENKVEVETKTNIPTKEVTKPVTNIKKTVSTNNKKVVTKSVVNKQVQRPVTTAQSKKTSTTTVKKTAPKQKTVTTQNKVGPQKVAQKNVSTPKTATKTVTKTMTEAERVRQETILWNKWRSDLQNQIMNDTRLPIVPQGTIFKFSFDVDKFGKITNVHTWSTNPSYTPYAIQYIAPVIRSYQGRSILNFPAGSNRVATTVNGGWKISTTSKYSTSADYNDSERVNRK